MYFKIKFLTVEKYYSSQLFIPLNYCKVRLLPLLPDSIPIIACINKNRVI